MKITETIEVLQQALEEYGDIPVALYTDHGQTLREHHRSGLSYVQDAQEYYLDEIDEEDLEYHESYDKVFVLEG